MDPPSRSYTIIGSDATWEREVATLVKKHNPTAKVTCRHYVPDESRSSETVEDESKRDTDEKGRSTEKVQ